MVYLFPGHPINNGLMGIAKTARMAVRSAGAVGMSKDVQCDLAAAAEKDDILDNILMSGQESSSAVPFQTADQQALDGGRFRLMKADTDEVLERQT